jgi:hypothetical protein
MSDLPKKNKSKNYSLNASSKETTINSISVSKLLKNKKYKTQNKLILCQYPNIFKEEFDQNDTPVKGTRLFSAKTHRTINNTKLIKKNAFQKNIIKNDSISYRANGDSQNSLKYNNTNIFFTGLNEGFRNKKINLRLKSATIHKDLDRYSRKAQEMKKKLNLFEIYKRSNYYSKVIIANKNQKKFLNNYLKKDLDLIYRNSNIYNYHSNSNYNNKTRSYYNHMFNRMLSSFLKQKANLISPIHINSCENRNYRTLNMINCIKNNSKLNKKSLFSNYYNNIFK